MIKWFRKNNPETLENSDKLMESQADVREEEHLPAEKKGLFSRLKSGLSKTRKQVGERIGRLVLGKKQVDAELLEELETLLLTAAALGTVPVEPAAAAWLLLCLI